MGSSEKRSKDVVMSDIPTFSASEEPQSHSEQVCLIQYHNPLSLSLVFKKMIILSCFWPCCCCVLFCSRTFLSIIAGVLAGIIGFTGLTGFLFYFVVMLITSLGLMAKAGFSADVYFDSWNRVLFDGFLGGLMVHYIFLFLATPPLSSCM